MSTAPLRTRLILILLLAAGLLALLPGLLARRGQPGVQARLAAPTPADLSGFARVEGPRPLAFPADHGPHPEYQTEWWYYTGNLDAEDGRHFGYQLTFFRRALLPPSQFPDRASGWATDQVYMAHFALTDVSGGEHTAFERLARGAAGLAGAQADPYQVWLEDWRVELDPSGAYRLRAAQDGLSIDLLLKDEKGPILQGDRGYSRKGAGQGDASYYYSLTRLASAGSVEVAGRRYAVTGLSWMDHEFSTSYLSRDQVGWDWFSVQLDNGSELMLFQLRRADGSLDPASSGTLVARDGATTHLSQQDFTVQVQDHWKSPHSGAVYPSRWAVTIPGAGLTLEIEPYLADQEMNVSYAYWEGAVRIRGQQDGQPVAGSGYVELTGYAGSMGGEF